MMPSSTESNMGGKATRRPYQKLPGTHKGFIVGKSTLWKGDDHLLQVYSRFGIEDYRRFYYQDIQALVVHKTLTGRGLTIVSGAAFALLAVIAAVTGGGVAVFYGVLAGIVGIVFLNFLFKGSSCRTYLLTAVQTERIKSLHRYATAIKVVEQLRPVIAGVQGDVAPEALKRQPVRAPERTERPLGVAPEPPKLKTPKHDSGRTHFVLCCLLILNALLIALDLAYSHLVVSLISTVCLLALMISILTALVRQQDSDISRSLKALSWVSLGYVGGHFLVGYVVSMVYSFRNPQPLTNQWEMYRILAELSPWESPFLLSFSIFTFISALLMGVSGLVWLREHRHAARRPRPRRPVRAGAAPGTVQPGSSP